MKSIAWAVFVTGILTGTLAAGPTAHISGPSEDFQGYMDPAMTVAVNMAKKKDVDGSRPPTVTALGVINGFSPYKNLNAEAGFDYKSCSNSSDDSPLYFNAKAGFAENMIGANIPGVVAGFFDLGVNSGKTNYNIVYGMTGKTFKLNATELGKFSAGWFVGNSSLLVDENGKKDNAGFMAGWDRVMPEISEKLWASVDYMGTKSAYGSLNLGLSWKFNSLVSVIFGYNRYNSRELVDTYNVQLTLGLGSGFSR